MTENGRAIKFDLYGLLPQPFGPVFTFDQPIRAAVMSLKLLDLDNQELLTFAAQKGTLV